MFIFRKKIKTVFDLPIDEARYKLESITDAVYRVIDSEKFKEISSKIKLPESATKSQVAKLVNDTAPLKVRQIFDLLLKDSYEDIMLILATVFNMPVEKYKLVKTINMILSDLKKLTEQNKADFIGFFYPATR